MTHADEWHYYDEYGKNREEGGVGRWLVFMDEWHVMMSIRQWRKGGITQWLIHVDELHYYSDRQEPWKEESDDDWCIRSCDMYKWSLLAAGEEGEKSQTIDDTYW